MNLPSPRLWATALLALSLFLPGAAAKGKPPALADIIYDRPGFLARLPKKCLTYPDFLNGLPGVADAAQLFEGELLSLGEPKDIEFVPLPAGFTRPHVVRSQGPEYPAAKVGAQQPGHADFLVLIGRTGGIAGLYCVTATDRLFAIAGANALVKWTFGPAYLGHDALPVLVMVRIRFTFILNGSEHSG